MFNQVGKFPRHFVIVVTRVREGGDGEGGRDEGGFAEVVGTAIWHRGEWKN